MAGAAAGSPLPAGEMHCATVGLGLPPPPLVLERLVGNAECHVRHRGWGVE